MTDSYHVLIYSVSDGQMSYADMFRLQNAVVTQLGECKTEDLEVAGSSPAYRMFF